MSFWSLAASLDLYCINYLEDHCNKLLIDENEKEHLRNMILELLKLTTNRGERKDRTIGHSALNHRLEELHIPFWIENDKGAWIIRRCGPVSTDDEPEL